MRRDESLEKALVLEKTEAGGDGDDRGWDGWMASQTQWTWVWASSGRWWRTGKPGVLWSKGSQRVRHNWETEWQQQHQIAGNYVLDSAGVMCSKGINHMAKAWPAWSLFPLHQRQSMPHSFTTDHPKDYLQMVPVPSHGFLYLLSPLALRLSSASRAG